MPNQMREFKFKDWQKMALIIPQQRNMLGSYEP